MTVTAYKLSFRAFILQPGERISISITWTPLEGGKVRELITFIVNDVVKHQAVLLGVAEQPLKKKKCLWDTIKKRTPALQSRCKKRLPIIKNVNATFQMSEKTDRGRSPLQSCENLEMKRESISSNGDSPILLENKISLSPISPILQENQQVTYTPLSMRRSTTYSVSGTAACDELLKDIKETCTVMPLCDYLVEMNLETACNTFNSVESQTSNTNSVCIPEQLKRSQIPLNLRRILSPDSFVNNNYELTEEPPTVPILSPDQFLKENQIAIQPTSQVPKCVPISSNAVSCNSRTFFPKEKEKMQVVTFSVEPQSSKKAHNNIHDRKISTPCYEKFELNVNGYRKTDKDQTGCLQKEQPKKRPVLSSTVTKSKPDPPKGKVIETLKPKSRKCLSNVIQQCVDIVTQSATEEMLPRLPVIEPLSGEAKCCKVKTASACLGSVSYSRKRKSGEYLEDTITGSEEYAKKFETKKVLMSFVENENQSAFKTSVPKSVNRGKQSQKKRPATLSQKSKTVRRTKNIVPVAQSHLTFVKPLKTDIPRHPMPFVAKNMFYDERWKEKQQRGFTWWLNFVLTPDDFTVKMDTSQVNAASLILGTESFHKSSVPKAPTKEEASLRAYTARCKLNKLRRSACRLFTSDEMVKAIKRLEVEIEAKRLLVRKDRHLWKDIGERQKILNWLLSYNPLWLRIGLETVYGELIALESNSDVMGLAMFVLNRLLWNPDIAAEYRHPTVPHLYRDGHEEALSKFTLKKLLLLVCFLDRAKLSRIIDHDPCLFCTNAEFKSSKQILLAFSRDFLSGEGDLSRHLGFLGFPVNHIQMPLDEFDFAITNLAVDLQCGIRLVRALELLSSNWSLSKKLRVPAISRLQKMHNVNIVLQVLKDHGIQLKDECGAAIDAKDIVDRHREKTFALLWKIVFAFQVNVALDVDQLKEEIEFLNNLHAVKAKTAALESYVASKLRKDRSSFYSPESYSENVKLLMDWVNAVCRSYSVKVENFTVSFSDGRVLCYLIHHYHPCYVPLEAICQHTTQTVECTKSGTLALNSSSESDASLNLLNGTFDQTITTSVLYKELLDNEKRNFQLINAAVSDLGGVPAMIHHSDMSNTIPDEKVVIIYVSFLCSRLLDLSKEIRAARLIQSAWRNYRLKAKLAQTKKQRFNATVVIQKHWRRYLAQMELQKLKKANQEEDGASPIVIQAAVVLQAWYRMKRERQHFLRMCGAAAAIQTYYRAYREQTSQRKRFLQVKKAAVHLQATFRGYKLRKMVKHQQIAAVKIQTAFRAYTARMKYQKLIQASLVIQKWYRASKASFKIRTSFLKTKAAVTSLQAALRGWQARKWIRKQHAAAITIQSAFRRYKALKGFRMVRNAALTLQQHYRARVLSRKQRQEYVVICSRIIQLQAAWRGSLVRKQIQRQHEAAVVIQSYYRMHINQTKFKCFRGAVVTVQRWCRATILARSKRQEYLALKKAALKMQAIYRGVRAQRKIQRMHRAAVSIQAMFKMHQDNVRYWRMKHSATIIQRRYRAFSKGKKEQEKYLELRSASLILQAAYRGMKVRQELKTLRQSVISIQSFYRMYRQRKSFQKLIAAAKLIQQWYRSCKIRNAQVHKYGQIKISALRIQSAFRGMKARLHLKRMHVAATIIQRRFRTFLQRQRFISLKTAAVTIQQMYRATVLSRQQHDRYWRMKLSATIIQRRYRAFSKGKKEREKYLELRNASLILQAAYRGIKVRQELKTLRQSVISIQSFYRMYRQRKSFQKLIAAAKLIQQWYRGCKIRNALVHKYRQMKISALRIQSAFRGMKARLHLKSLHAAATIIQRRFRTFLQRQRFISLKTAAVTIQQMYRATVLSRQQHDRYWRMKHSATIIQRRYRAFSKGKKEREKYLELRNASLILQAAYRGIKVRQELKTLRQSVISIQSFYRMYRQRKSFQKLIAAAKLIQQWYRGCKIRNALVHKYRQMKISALRIQSAFRGMKARLHLKSLHAAATIIQRRFRTFLQRQRFISLKTAAVTIQQMYRATVLSRQQREEYLCLRKAAVMVQSSFRGQLVRKFVKRMHLASTIIQAAFRMHIAYTHYRAVKFASVTIQQHYRAYREAKRVRELYLKQRHSALVLQAAYRGMKIRHTLRKQHNAATIIQSSYRKHRQQCSVQKIQRAATVIQRRLRANKLSRIAVQQYSSVKRATICIQKAFRRMRARRCLKRHQAAIVLQRNFKMQRERRSYLAFKAATIVLQRRYRALIRGRTQRQEYISVRGAVVCVQSSYRGFKIRKDIECMHLAARVIQASFRMHKARLSYQRLRDAAVTIQNYYRSHLKRKHQRNAYLTFRKSAVLVQATYRGMKTRQKLKAMHVSATVIQSLYRMHVQRKQYKLICWAVLIIQSAYRGAIARKKGMEAYGASKIQSFFMAEDHTKCIQFRTAALVLQSQCHVNEAREQYQKYWEAALLIQQRYRSYVTVKHQRLAYLQSLKSIIIMQATVRGFIERRRFCKMKRSVIKIQALFRGYKVRQLTAQRPSVFPQAWFIRCRTMEEFRAIEKSTCVIQSYQRAKQQRIWFLKMKASVILIQRKWRATMAAKVTLQKFLAIKTAVVVIQSAYRRYDARKQFKRVLEERRQNLLLHFTAAAYHHLAATRIQRAYRIHLHLKHEHLQLSSVLYIQRWYRAKLQRRRYLQYREKIIILQRRVRRWISCRNVAAGGVQEKLSQKILSNGITKFQALWRGYSWRKKTDTPKTRALRDSLLIANKESNEEKKLCNRTALAIDRLLKYKHFSYILAALKDLEVVTRLSPVCCESMAQTEAVYVIFTLIRSCNRSVPSKDVIRYSVQILLNLSKYERTAQAVYTVKNSVETLLDLLQMYRERAGDKISEKGGSIFTKTCCLFALLLKDSRRAYEIQSRPRVVSCLQSLFKLTARKHKMDAQRILAKQKLGAYKNGYCSDPVTPGKAGLISRQRPDWVLRKDNIPEIVDPLQAIEMVMDTLGISFL
ncbi:abnormal spindle-like microcephaly-associated protein homolog [Elgaria multicarinata webbii]|uniref:abnormal spindle-like microcephaly-associated protein homolog n=1 Tax=Elgaria multicarinata webbii TaxID=159646 RepID=UPI002FCCB8B2